MKEWSEVCRQASNDYCDWLEQSTRTFPRWERRIAVHLEVKWSMDQLRQTLVRARSMATPNTLRGLLCSILCIAYATQRRGSHVRLHPVQAWLRSLLRNLDTDPIATTDAPGVLPGVLLRGQEMLAALAAQALLRRLAEKAHPQVVGPDWLVARQ